MGAEVGLTVPEITPLLSMEHGSIRRQTRLHRSYPCLGCSIPHYEQVIIPLRFNLMARSCINLQISQGSIRAQAEVAWNVSLFKTGHTGNTTYIVGDIFDAQYTTERVLGNDTVISATLITSEGLPFDLPRYVEYSTGEFNLSVVMQRIYLQRTLRDQFALNHGSTWRCILPSC